MSCCNQGKSKSHGVKYNFSDDHSKFDYDTGISGEFRFDWFGDYLNAYLDGVAKAAVTFPLVKQKVLDMFDRIKGMKNQILIYASVFPQLSDKYISIFEIKTQSWCTCDSQCGQFLTWNENLC